MLSIPHQASISELILVFLTVPDGSNTEVDQGLKDKVIQQIHQACRDVGFFYLTGHGVEQSTLDKIFTVMKSFFALPLATKNTINIHNSEFYRGYFETSKFHYMHYPFDIVGLIMAEQFTLRWCFKSFEIIGLK